MLNNPDIRGERKRIEKVTIYGEVSVVPVVASRHAANMRLASKPMPSLTKHVSIDVYFCIPKHSIVSSWNEMRLSENSKRKTIL